MNDPRTIARVVLHGRVQGVGYRAWLERAALTADIEGWVRNRGDGSVEAVFSGPAETVDALVERCRQGPRGARIDTLERHAGAPELLHPRRPGERFSVLPNA